MSRPGLIAKHAKQAVLKLDHRAPVMDYAAFVASCQWRFDCIAIHRKIQNKEAVSRRDGRN